MDGSMNGWFIFSSAPKCPNYCSPEKDPAAICTAGISCCSDATQRCLHLDVGDVKPSPSKREVFTSPLHCATCEITNLRCLLFVFLNSSPTKCDPLVRGVGEEADSVRPPQLSLRRSSSADLLPERILERLLWGPAARKHTRMKIWLRKEQNYKIFPLSATAERILFFFFFEASWLKPLVRLIRSSSL